MSRHTITVHAGDQIDRAATVGHDRMLRTYFLQAFPHEDDGCRYWLGCFLEEYPTLESLQQHAHECGLRLDGITDEMREAMLQETRRPTQCSIGEVLGLVQ